MKDVVSASKLVHEESDLYRIRINCHDFEQIQRLTDSQVIAYFERVQLKSRKKMLPKTVRYSSLLVSRLPGALIIHLQDGSRETGSIHFVPLRRPAA
jgi:hypothetical protein